MKMKFSILSAAMSLCAACAISSANAALVSELNGQVVYDSTSNVSWMANTDLAATQNFGVSGISASGSMHWDTAMNWIAAMNASNYLGYNDWRLPSTLQPDSSCSVSNSISSYGSGCSGSEMGNMFYNELGGVSGSSILATHNANYASFQFNPSQFSGTSAGDNWSGTTLYYNTTYSWSFALRDGSQGVGTKATANNYAWAVRAGDSLTASAVPVPAAAWLFGSGLFGLAGFARKQGA